MNLNIKIDLEDIECPNKCKKDDIIVFTGKDRLHNLEGTFTVLRCKKCGLERTSPRPTPNTIGNYYPENYGPYNDVPYLTFEPTSIIKSIIINFLGLRTRVLPNVKPGKMLEIGCSSGSYMQYVRNKGWLVDGIEFSTKAAQIAINKGFDVKIGAVEDLNPSNKPYDIIVAWMVMEHLHDPVATLTKIKSWLKKDGYFVFLIPDNKSISRKLFKDLSFDTQLPTHLFHYNESSIKYLLEQNGWVIDKIYYQRNCNTFLKSLEIWCQVYKKYTLLKIIKNFNKSNYTKFIRLLFAILLGYLKESGRMEITARPKYNG
jgi:SAM-dependent methyltransferase